MNVLGDESGGHTHTRISRQALLMSDTLREMLTNVQDNVDVVLPVHGVYSCIMLKVCARRQHGAHVHVQIVEYLEHHKHDVTAHTSANNSDSDDDDNDITAQEHVEFAPLDEWDTQFFDVDDNVRIHIIAVCVRARARALVCWSGQRLFEHRIVDKRVRQGDRIHNEKRDERVHEATV
jgi:hypothetical protein